MTLLQQALEALERTEAYGPTSEIEAITALRAAIEQGMVVQQWKPASSPPSESQGEVLVLMGDGRCEIAWATYWHGASNAFAQWTFRDPDEDGSPTHWQPLPPTQENGK